MISNSPKLISGNSSLKPGDRFEERPNLSELARKMRLEEEVEGDPKCKDCLGRGLLVRIRGKAHHIDKCGCVHPIKKDPDADKKYRILGQEVLINAGRS